MAAPNRACARAEADLPIRPSPHDRSILKKLCSKRKAQSQAARITRSFARSSRNIFSAVSYSPARRALSRDEALFFHLTQWPPAPAAITQDKKRAIRPPIIPAAAIPSARITCRRLHAYCALRYRLVSQTIKTLFVISAPSTSEPRLFPLTREPDRFSKSSDNREQTILTALPFPGIESTAWRFRCFNHLEIHQTIFMTCLSRMHSREVRCSAK